jgi:hypothetical protein
VNGARLEVEAVELDLTQPLSRRLNETDIGVRAGGQRTSSGELGSGAACAAASGPSRSWQPRTRARLLRGAGAGADDVAFDAL